MMEDALVYVWASYAATVLVFAALAWRAYFRLRRWSPRAIPERSETAEIAAPLSRLSGPEA